MKIKNIFIASLALMAMACQDNSDITTGQPTNPTPGQDVQFGGSVNKGVTDKKNAHTRTIYGDEANNAFPIYWLKGDQVVVTSPQCATKKGVYQVPDEADMRNYAGQFSKTGAGGVQWGEEPTADFYSIYPAAGVKEIGQDYKSFTLTMPAVQENPVEVKTDGKLEVKPGMDGCFMYARTMAAPNGATVDLGYSPLSTAIRFTLKGGDNSIDQNRKTTIEKAVLRAPQGTALAGNFKVSFADDGTPQYTLVGNGSNEIEIKPFYKASSGYISLNLDESVELNAFIIPQNTTVTIGSGWELEVYLTDNKSYKMDLGSVTATMGKNMNLVAGKIHRIDKLNNLPILVEWNNTNWMQYIPRNVYLSEVSIPGSWNSINEDSQAGRGTGQIDAQYTAGIRAFHFDTRWEGNLLGNVNNSNTLAVADGSTSYPLLGGGGKVINDGATDFTAALNALAAKAAANTEEYCVLLCTYAQGNKDNTNIHWITAINNACDACPNKDDIVMSSEINANTVVGDVLGKLIVIVGTENEVSNYTEIPAGSKYFYSHIPAMLNQATYQANNYNDDDMYNNATAKSDIHLYNTQAQVSAYNRNGTDGIATNNLGYAPTIDERKTKAGNIYRWSKENYEKGEFTHNNWIFVGLGGYYVTNTSGSRPSGVDQSNIAEVMNTWLGTEILDKMKDVPNESAGETGYYPVGMPYMNKVGSYQTLVDNIISLNTKYRKAYDPNKSSDTGLPKDNGTSDINSSAPGYSSGVIDGNENAIGWTSSN